jgi:hypothetical protein
MKGWVREVRVWLGLPAPGAAGGSEGWVCELVLGDATSVDEPVLFRLM